MAIMGLLSNNGQTRSLIHRVNGAITSVHAAALIIGGAGLLSRFLGIFRDRLLAGRFGAGRQLDMYYAAFQIPDLMATIFLLGAGSAAILPVFQEYLKEDRERARQLIASLNGAFVVGAGIVCTVMFAAAPMLVSLIAPGFSGEEKYLTISLTRIMLLSPLFFGLSSILSSVVQSFHRFVSYALAPIFYNLGIIAGIVFFFPMWGMKGLAVGVVLGAMLHWLTQVYALSEIGFLPRIALGRLNSGVWRVIRISFPRVLSLSLSNITLLGLVALGSMMSKGSISIFELAQNLYFVPIGLFGISYSVAIFPRLSDAYLNKNANDFFRELFSGIRTIFFWIAPSTVLFLILRVHLVRVTLRSGAFSWEDTRLTAASLAALVLAMAAGALIPLLIKSFYALERTWVPLGIELFSAVITVVSASILSSFFVHGSASAEYVAGLFRVSDIQHHEMLALALALAFGTIVNVSLLYIFLLGTARRIFSYAPSFPLSAITKIIASAVISGGVAYMVRIIFPDVPPAFSLGRIVIQGVIIGFVGAGSYAVLLILLKSEDMIILIRGFKRRFFSIGALPKSWNGDGHMLN